MTRRVLVSVAVAAVASCTSAAVAADGAQIFSSTCQACHQAGGVGAPGLAPPLVSPILKNAAARQKDYPVMVVTKGLTGTLALADGGSITGAMPPQQALADTDVAAVVNYVFHLNRTTAAVKAADVARIRAAAATNEDLKRLRLELSK
ncbi:MAG: cytochrome c [Xanthobacteraceae bacterium]|nr:cytochrome c [Xanthobacteraceae bacterium]